MAFGVGAQAARRKRWRSARRNEELQHNNGMHPTANERFLHPQDAVPVMLSARRVMPGVRRKFTLMQIETIYNDVKFDDEGFAAPWFTENKIMWRDIIRVAKCMVIEGLVDVHDYWAFQTKDPELLIWVSITPSTDFIRACFSDAVVRQFGITNRAISIKWNRACKGCNLSSYVVYPEADAGKPMYFLRRKHWWSWRGELRHALA